MFMALNRGYLPPSLKQIPSKGNIWYVIITKPEPLRDGKKNIQIRRSTGTSDSRIARAKQSQIVEEVYAEWDKHLERDPFCELLEQNGFYDPIHQYSAQDFVEHFGKVAAAFKVWMSLCEEHGQQHPIVDEMFRHLNYQEALGLVTV
jgi:hypothetical protein